MNRCSCLAGVVLASSALTAHAVTSIELGFDGNGSNLDATGFDAVFNLNPTQFNVADGMLSINTQPGDIFGRFESDPDDAQNVFFSEIDPLDRMTVEAKVTLTGLNVNFHGGGIWMGMDTDHYIRIGVAHNTFEGPIVVESLRENEDRWALADPPGQGDEIVSERFGIGGESPQAEPVTVILRLVQEGNTGFGSFSLDDGETFTQVGPVYSGLALPGDPQGLGSDTIEQPESFKVGLWAFGGPDGSTAATASFDWFTAMSEEVSAKAPGDADGDGDVDAFDLGLWQTQFGSVGEGLTADFDMDSDVDAFDLGIWQINFGTGLNGAAVPEPAAATLLTLGLAALARRRR